MVSIDLKLYHCTGWKEEPYLVADLGIFEAPENAFRDVNNTITRDYFMVTELIQSEHGVLEDPEHELLSKFRKKTSTSTGLR